MSKCGRCGALNEDDASFCSLCLTPLRAAPSDDHHVHQLPPPEPDDDDRLGVKIGWIATALCLGLLVLGALQTAAFGDHGTMAGVSAISPHADVWLVEGVHAFGPEAFAEPHEPPLTLPVRPRTRDYYALPSGRSRAPSSFGRSSAATRAFETTRSSRVP